MIQIKVDDGLSRFNTDKFLLKKNQFSSSGKYAVWDEKGRTLVYVRRARRLFLSFLSIVLGLVVAAGCVMGVVSMPLENFVVKLSLGAIGAFLPFLFIVVAFYPKRQITFSSDPDNKIPILKIIQKTKFGRFKAQFDVSFPNNVCLARFTKNNLFDLFRTRWNVYRHDGYLWAVAKEDSILKAFLGRFFGSFFGLLKTDFVIFREDQKTLRGRFHRNFNLLGRYVLDYSEDKNKDLDRRVALALGVILNS